MVFGNSTDPLLVGFHPATRSVQSTPADNTQKRVWQYIEKERNKLGSKGGGCDSKIWKKMAKALIMSKDDSGSPNFTSPNRSKGLPYPGMLSLLS